MLATMVAATDVDKLSMTYYWPVEALQWFYCINMCSRGRCRVCGITQRCVSVVAHRDGVR